MCVTALLFNHVFLYTLSSSKCKGAGVFFGVRPEAKRVLTGIASLAEAVEQAVLERHAVAAVAWRRGAGRVCGSGGAAPHRRRLHALVLRGARRGPAVGRQLAGRAAPARPALAGARLATHAAVGTAARAAALGHVAARARPARLTLAAETCRLPHDGDSLLHD